jgi:hypothetical protein
VVASAGQRVLVLRLTLTVGHLPDRKGQQGRLSCCCCCCCCCHQRLHVRC